MKNWKRNMQNTNETPLKISGELPPTKHATEGLRLRSRHSLGACMIALLLTACSGSARPPAAPIVRTVTEEKTCPTPQRPPQIQTPEIRGWYPLTPETMDLLAGDIEARKRPDFHMCLPKLDYDQLSSFLRGEVTRYILEAESYMSIIESGKK